MEEVKLQKFMADAGIASRRKCEQIIADGKVKVNGKVAELGMRVNPKTDRIEMGTKRIKPPLDHIYIMMNKPGDCVCTCSDDKGRKTVLDYLPSGTPRVFPVGRLDFATEGLLILTSDGDFANALMHPAHQVQKKYLVVIAGHISDLDVRRLESGVTIDGRRTAPAKIVVLKEEANRTELLCIIREGRNRQLRKMFDVVDKRVLYIKRVGVGSLRLGNLHRGKTRQLSAAEIDALRRDAGV